MIVSMRSRSKVFHRPGCHYAENIKEENTLYDKTKWLIREGYRPCKWCCGANGRVQIEYKTASEYLKSSDIVMDLKDHMMYIRSDVGCWKLVYSIKEDRYILFHRNYADGIVPIEEVESVPYHRQADHFYFDSIIAAAKYIVKHDQAKKILSVGSYRNLPKTTKKQKKYYKAAKDKAHRNNIHRIDELFRSIETERNQKQCSNA